MTPGYPWDDGVNWRTELVEAPAAGDLPLVLDYVKRAVLHVVNDGYNDDKITSDIWAATEEAERCTERALMPQTRALLMDRLPCGSGRIVVPHPPFIEIVSFVYLDSNGDEQELAVSPQSFRVVPSGRVSKAELWPLDGASWPTTSTQPNAVTITYRAGYANAGMIPRRILTGIELMVSELYKQRSMSVAGTSSIPSVIQPERFWSRVY